MRIQEEWAGLRPALRRIIVAELIVLALLVLVCMAARAETSPAAAAATSPDRGGQDEAAVYECVVHRGEWVWIRETPEPTGRKIGRVRYGYEVQSGEPVDNYLSISVRPGWLLEGEHAERGYVDASYFLRAVPEKMYRVNTTGPLAKRETPGGRLLCWIKPGVKISVLGYRTDKDGQLWAHVYKGGYVYAGYLAEL